MHVYSDFYILLESEFYQRKKMQLGKKTTTDPTIDFRIWRCISFIRIGENFFIAIYLLFLINFTTLFHGIFSAYK